MAGRFAGKVVVVTGASSGVGRACARAFADEGADVGLIARSVEGLSAAADEARAAGSRALVLPLDVAGADAVEAAAEQVETELGPIDIWVNNAMVSVFSPISEMTADEFRRVTDVTYLGSVYGTLAALKRMRRRDSGTIIQIGSALVYRSIPLQSAYCAAKAAIRGFTDSLRTELLHEGSRVKVSMLQLPAVNTPQFDVVRTRLPGRPQPVPPIYQPEMIAEAVLWAAERHPREMVIASSALKAILGQKLIPGLLDRYLAKTGFASQQADVPVEPGRRDNLYEPVPGDQGAHGSFDERAKQWAPQLTARMRPIAVASALVAICVAAITGIIALGASDHARRGTGDRSGWR
jgi:NAD(P)-dependent dehydrogenase (short-subunit alcohol dehydrogenase family)